MGTIRYLRFSGMRLQGSWLSPAYVGVDDHGVIQYLSEKAPTEAIALETVEGFALPGFQNAHSHAFQYAMAGLAEVHPVGIHDDFWTWREAMYQCALSVNPDQAEAIATQLYAEMARHGYTHVAEFHYLHHDSTGKPYENLAEMGERMVAAAATAGIKITLIPVFYQMGGFGQKPQPRQKRFISPTRDDYFKLLDASAEVIKKNTYARLGVSVHSLRAVTSEDTIYTIDNTPRDLPFHIHVSEQLKEVDDCLNHLKQRPMQWLLNNTTLNDRFYLVHATHLDDTEVTTLAGTGANVVLCPSTEGNLGDGIFRMKDYVRAGGQWCIGTDSHIGINPLEEFRMIDYRQRLITHQRNTFKDDGGSYMIDTAALRGRGAMGLPSQNHFAVGLPLDAVIYDAKSPLLEHTSDKFLSSTLVYSNDSGRAIGTLVNGRWIVKQQRHIRQKEIGVRFSKTMSALKSR